MHLKIELVLVVADEILYWYCTLKHYPCNQQVELRCHNHGLCSTCSSSCSLRHLGYTPIRKILRLATVPYPSCRNNSSVAQTSSSAEICAACKRLIQFHERLYTIRCNLTRTRKETDGRSTERLIELARPTTTAHTRHSEWREFLLVDQASGRTPLASPRRHSVPSCFGPMTTCAEHTPWKTGTATLPRCSHAFWR